MFKAARWRSEKNKFKAVFKMGFLVTQVSQPKWDALVISLIPLEAGKPTARSEKAVVSNGSCQWEKPIYETVKFIQEPKAGITHNKIYRIVVSETGSPKADLLGEATIDFADYVKASKPCSVSLPLKAADSSLLLLHVTIQRLQDEVNGREFEERVGKMVKTPWRVLKSQPKNWDKEESYSITSGTDDSCIIEDRPPTNGEVHMKFPSTGAVVLHAESNDNLEESDSLDALPVLGSDNSSGLFIPVKYGSKNSRNIHQDSTRTLSPLSNTSTPRRPTSNNLSLLANYGDHQRSNTDWSLSSAADGTMDGSTANADKNELRESVQGSDISLCKLRNDLVVLARQVETSELELQSLRKQVVKEQRKREDLSRDLCNMKEERDAFRRECEQLKATYREDADEEFSDRPQLDDEDLRSIIEKIKQELNHEKNLNTNLLLQLQTTQKSKSNSIFAVNDLDETLEQKNRELSSVNCDDMFDKQICNHNSQGGNKGNRFPNLQHFESRKQLCQTPFGHKQDAEQYALEALVKGNDMKIEFSLEQKVMDLNNEIESYRKDNEELEMQMEQLALDYEILRQENHDISLKLQQTQLREQLRMQYECSAHTSIINDLEARVESLEKELEEQAEAFEADLSSVTSAKVDQEKRAIQLQEALTKAKWRSVTIAECLQEELKRLSIQMSSTFNENEKLVIQAVAEASELCLKNSQLEELLEKAHVELASVQECFRSKLEDLSSELDLSRRQREQVVIELQERAEELEYQKKSEAERIKAFSEEMVKLKAQRELLVREKNDTNQPLKQKDDSIENVEQQEKLNELRLLKEEKESVIRTLSSELATLKVDHSNLKRSLFENNLEKENLRKQVLHLRDDFQKKEDTIAILKKSFMGNDKKAASLDSSAKLSARKNSRSGFVPHKGVTSLHKKVKPLEAKLKVSNAALQDANSFSERGLDNGKEEQENVSKDPGQHNPGFREDNEQKMKEARDMMQRTNDYHTIEEKNEEILIKYSLMECPCACISDRLDQGSHIRKGFGSGLDEALPGNPDEHDNLA